MKYTIYWNHHGQKNAITHQNLKSNLKDLKNPNLRINVLLGIITPERLAVLTAEEMASDALKQERSKLNETAINEYQLAMDEGTGTDLIQCRK